MKLVVLLLLGLLGSLSLAYSVDYTGYTIQECSTSSEDVADLVYGVIHAFDIDEISHRPDSVTVLVEPKKKDLFQGLHCKVVVEDVQKVIEQEALNLVLSRAEAELLPLKNDTDPYHKTYHTYNEIVAKVTDIAKQYPTIVKQSVAGTTLEGRNLPLLRITGPNGASKKTIFLNGGIHAREWVSPATMVYIIQSLAGDYGKDSTVTALLDQIEFYIIPISNPDGYSYTWTNDRLWRKNRNPNGGGCVGVDLNRNFDVYWGTGSSSSKCAADYHGAGAASEPEVKAIQNLVAGMPNKIGAIDIHAYGQYIMRPYGWTNALHPEETILKKLGDGIVSVIKQTTGTVYSSIRSAELYPVSGASDDWFTVKQNLWGFCFELRDNGRYGFELPESQILGTAQEIYAGVLNYADFVLNNF